MDLRRCAVPGGADGVAPGFQNRELKGQEASRHPQGRELLQHLQDFVAIGELPFVIVRGLKAKCSVQDSGHLLHTEGRGCHNLIFIHLFTPCLHAGLEVPGAVQGAERTKLERK